jgi:hypothetical protein
MRSAILRAQAHALWEACDKINAEAVARIEEAEAILYVAGYEFKNGCYVQSDQCKAYRAKLDEIHETAMRLMGRK